MSERKNPLVIRREEIANQFEPFRLGFTKDYPELYEYLISDFDEYIKNVSITTPETCLNHIALANQAMQAITGYDDPIDNRIILTHPDLTKVLLWTSSNLIEISETAAWPFLNEQIKQYGSLSPYFGYFAIYLLNIIRQDIDLITDKIKDQVLVGNADIILGPDQSEKSQQLNEAFIKKAMKRLNKYARNILNKKYLPSNCQEISDPDELTTYTIEAIMKTIPDNIEKVMLASDQEKINIAYTPNLAAERCADKIKTNEVFYNNIPIISLDSLIATDANITFNEVISDFRKSKSELEILEEKEVIKEAKNFKDYTLREQQVIKMKFYPPDNIEYTDDEIGKELGISRVRVIAITKQALNKLRKHFNPPPE